MDESMTAEAIVRAALRAVEARDHTRLLELYHPEVEFSWPPGLPYSGVHRGAEVVAMGATYAGVWEPLQPTEAERSLDEELVAAGPTDVVVRYRLKGVDRSGRRFATDTLAHYEVRDGKFAGAHMYHFDLVGLVDFVAGATA